MNTPDPANWPAIWAGMAQEQRDEIARSIARYAGFLPPGDHTASTTAPTLETLTAALHWQAVEKDVLQEHAAWLARTKAMFDRRGWPWTTGELAARSHVREVGE